MFRLFHFVSLRSVIFALLTFILARLTLLRFHLISIQDPKQKFYSFTKQTETVSIRTETKNHGTIQPYITETCVTVKPISVPHQQMSYLFCVNSWPEWLPTRERGNGHRGATGLRGRWLRGGSRGHLHSAGPRGRRGSGVRGRRWPY
jgi:hypothetical protein